MMKIEKVYDKTYHGRKLIILYHEDLSRMRSPLFDILPDMAGSEWYCGYMQVLLLDKEFKIFARGHLGYWELPEKAYPTAIGGITFSGTLRGPFYDGYHYFGFDTNHVATRDATLAQCVDALKGMVHYEEQEAER